MSKFKRWLYSPRANDLAFAFAGLASAALLATGPLVRRVSPPPFEYSPVMGFVLVAVIVAASVFAAFIARLDNRNLDEYMFLLLAKSALIAIVTLIVAWALWTALFAGNLGDLPGAAMMPMVFLAWSAGYGYTRIRGTGPEA